MLNVVMVTLRGAMVTRLGVVVALLEVKSAEGFKLEGKTGDVLKGDANDHKHTI